MDPQACLHDLLENIVNGDRENVIEGLESLLRWVEGGGFLPTVDHYVDDDITFYVPRHVRGSNADS